MSMNKEFEHISQEKFQFVQLDASLHDQKIETKARGFFADAMVRFKKNKSSVIAAWILLFLALYALITPIVSPYDINDMDSIYSNTPPFISFISDLNLGFLDGGKVLDSQNDAAMNAWNAIGAETGHQPVIKVLDTTTTLVKDRGQMVERKSYTIRINNYYSAGMIYRTFTAEEYKALQEWQNETGIQVIYPYVEPKDIGGITNNPNIWYKVDSRGAAKLDKNGNYVPMYSTRESVSGADKGFPYNSLRVEGDDGSYIYGYFKSGAVQCRLFYYNYYQYMYGHEPMYIFGTNNMGQDLFSAIGVGARFSILFAILVSAINLSIGAVYGAIQGYYGGWVDMVLDRISDILSGIPFTVVATLFNLHLAAKVGQLVAFLFAFVLTGWIGMSALVRKQFYRFKSQEFVMAARTLGASDWRLMFKHIFPNGLGTIITSCALTIPGVIGSETNLTYLGIVNLADFAGTTVGTLLSQGQATMTTAPHAMLWPSVYFALLMICFNLFGNGLRDAFNPSTRGGED